MTFCGNCSLYFSLKFNAFTAFNKCYHRAETRCAVGLSSQFTEQLVYVALRIAVLACITCGVDTRTSVKRRHLQTGVVGKAVVSVFVLHPTRFKHGVAFDCSRRFRNVVVTTYFRKTENIVLSSCNSPYFLKLVFIICSEYNILHIFLIIQLFYLLKTLFYTLYFTTMLTILFGTTITLTTVLPSSQRAAFSFSRAKRSTSALSVPFAT